MGAILAAAVVFTAVFFLRRGGVLTGIPALAFGCLLACLLPWSPSLSRRVLLVGALFLGWIPLLWWVKLPVPQVDRMGLVLAIASAALVVWTLWAPNVGARAKRMLPRLTLTDAIMVAALILAVWTVWPLLHSPGPEATLNVLSGNSGLGADHVSHSAMVLQIREQGAIVPVLGQAPDGSAWVWSSYPQNFHASIVSLIELYSGSDTGGAATEILRYGRSLALMQVLIVVLLAAGVAQLSNLRRRPALAWPVAAVVVAAFLFGTGSWAFKMGYENFIWACAAAGLAVLMASTAAPEMPILRLFALGGLVIAAVHSWTLMAPLAVVGACVAFIPLKRSPLFEPRRNLYMTIAVLVAALAASAVVLPILMREGIGAILTIQADWVPQGMDAYSPLMLAAGMAVAAALAAYVRGQDSGRRARALALVAIPVVGFLQLAALGLYQVARIDEVSYYFDKTIWGLGLVSVAVLAAAISLHVDPTPSSRGTSGRIVAALACLVATVAGTQLFGLEGVDYRDWAEGRIAEAPPIGHRILEATAIAESRPFGSTVYLAAMPGDPYPTLSDRYIRGLSVTWSDGTTWREQIFRTIQHRDGIDVVEATTAVREFLGHGEDVAVVVAPELLDDIRAGLPSELRERVLTWESQQ